MVRMAEKIKLKDYQKSILDKLESIKTDATPVGIRYLGVTIGGRHVLINLLEISETLTMVDIQPIPLVKPWFLGMSNIRGTLYAINDLVQLLDNQPTQISSDTRMLLMNKRIISNVGFLVDKLIGLRAEDALKPLTASTEDSFCFSPARYEDDEKRIWYVLDCKKMVNSRMFELPYATL
jgi:twitching motility protein PilI